MQAQYVLFFTVNGNWQGKFNLPLSSSPLSVVLVLQLGNLPRIDYHTEKQILTVLKLLVKLTYLCLIISLALLSQAEYRQYR